MNLSARSRFPDPGAPAARSLSTDRPFKRGTAPRRDRLQAPAPATAGPLTGAYVTLSDLLAIRYRRSVQSPQAVMRRGERAGARLSKLRGRGIDFSEVRLYQPGDDIRTIDWRVTARKNRPHTKVFREERERPTLVVVDQTQSLFFGSRVRLKSVAAAEFGAMAAWQALAGDDRVGGLILDNAGACTHKPLRSVRTVVRLLSDLAERNSALNRDTRLQSEAHYRDSLLKIRRLVHTGYRILVVSDFRTATDTWQETLRALARHNQLTVLRIADPLERELPPADRYTVTDGTARWQFHSGNANLRRRYADRYEERNAALASFCAAYMIRYLSCATDDPVPAGDWW